MTWNGATLRYEGTVDCAVGTIDVFVECGEVTGLGGMVNGWVLWGELCNNPVIGGPLIPGQIGKAFFSSCDPFHASGGTEAFEGGRCCGDCSVGESLEWELNE